MRCSESTHCQAYSPKEALQHLQRFVSCRRLTSCHSQQPMPVLSYCRQVIMQWTTRDAGSPVAKLGTQARPVLAFVQPLPEPELLLCIQLRCPFLQSGNYSITKQGNSTTYTPADLCTSPANDTGYIFPGRFQRVLVDNLSPNTKYYYVVGDMVQAFLSRSFDPACERQGRED